MSLEAAPKPTIPTDDVIRDTGGVSCGMVLGSGGFGAMCWIGCVAVAAAVALAGG